MDTLRSPDTFDTHLGEWASANVQPLLIIGTMWKLIRMNTDHIESRTSNVDVVIILNVGKWCW